MSRLQQLYQQMILDHNRNPRNYHPVENANHKSHGHNPLCGDDYYLTLRLNDKNIIEEIGFEGSGCAISKSSASMMTEAIKGKSAAEAAKLKNSFLEMLVGTANPDDLASIGNLRILEGVKEFPVRVKCATLIWRTLENILTGAEKESASTE